MEETFDPAKNVNELVLATYNWRLYLSESHWCQNKLREGNMKENDQIYQNEIANPHKYYVRPAKRGEKRTRCSQSG